MIFFLQPLTWRGPNIKKDVVLCVATVYTGYAVFPHTSLPARKQNRLV
jgi:hypothetical protein